MKHLSKATECDAFGEKETIRWRNVESVLEVARPEGFEPPTLCSGGTRSIHLSYGRIPNRLDVSHCITFSFGWLRDTAIGYLAFAC